MGCTQPLCQTALLPASAIKQKKKERERERERERLREKEKRKKDKGHVPLASLSDVTFRYCVKDTS